MKLLHQRHTYYANTDRESHDSPQPRRATLLHEVNHTFKNSQEEEFTCSPQIERILFGEVGMVPAMIIESYIPTTNCNIVVHEQMQM